MNKYDTIESESRSRSLPYGDASTPGFSFVVSGEGL